MKGLISEFLGTFFLLMAIGLTGDPYWVAAILAVLVYLGYRLSGSQFNPSVSLAVWMRGRMKFQRMIMFMLMQFCGALTAAFVVWWMRGTSVAPRLMPELDIWKALLGEAAGTFVLVTVILHSVTSRHTKGNYYYGIAIALAVFISALFIGPYTGSAINPAVGVAPALVDFFMGYKPVPAHLWIYAAGPFFGALMAVLFFRLTNPSDHSDTASNKHKAS